MRERSAFSIPPLLGGVQQGRNLGGKINTASESARILISTLTIVKVGVGDNVKKIATRKKNYAAAFVE